MLLFMLVMRWSPPCRIEAVMSYLRNITPLMIVEMYLTLPLLPMTTSLFIRLQNKFG